MKSLKANKINESGSYINSIEYGKVHSIRKQVTEYLNKRNIRTVTFNGPEKPEVVAARKAAAERAKSFR